MTSSWLSTTCALCFLAGACSSPGGSTPPASTPANLPGYIHAFGRSRFDLGALLSEVDELGMHKLIGSDGTFATELVSEAAIGLHNVPFPDPITGVYPGDADAQNATVTSYFVTAGLPEDQIASISSDGAVLVHGQDVLSGSYSMLHRGWKGIPIDDSMAHAALDARGRSVSEQVYWPEIPGAVLAKANALQLLLSDPVRRAAYLNGLPGVSRAAVLAIRHTAWYWEGDFQARACCRGPNPGDPCFDEDGQLVRFPSDGESAPDAGPPGGAIDAGDGTADTEPRIVCPTSDTGIFLELPSGACSGVGSCAIQIDNTCRPGRSYVSSTPTVFDCRCESGQWNCEVIGGGMGLRPCGDAGP